MSVEVSNVSAPGTGRIGGGEIGAKPIYLSRATCSSGPCSVQSTHGFSLPDSISGCRPNVGIWDRVFWGGTRGAQGRAKLQAELAAQRGTFFSAVLGSMARRMHPALPVEGSPEEMMQRGISGTRYLERFGGFGKHRELGCLQHQVMTIMDFLQVGNLPAARDAAALLAVTLDQAALDNGRFDLANLLCLQEDPPSSVFTHKPANVLSRATAFTPLASQQWVTVALAYLKELDIISAKRLELTAPSKQGAFAASSSTAENPRPKGAPKKKGKGSGRGAGGSHQQEEED